MIDKEKRSISNQTIFKPKDFYKFIGSYPKQFINKTVTKERQFQRTKQRKTKPMTFNLRIKPNGYINKRMTKRNQLNKNGVLL